LSKLCPVMWPVASGVGSPPVGTAPKTWRRQNRRTAGALAEKLAERARSGWAAGGLSVGRRRVIGAPISRTANIFAAGPTADRITLVGAQAGGKAGCAGRPNFQGGPRQISPFSPKAVRCFAYTKSAAVSFSSKRPWTKQLLQIQVDEGPRLSGAGPRDFAFSRKWAKGSLPSGVSTKTTTKMKFERAIGPWRFATGKVRQQSSPPRKRRACTTALSAGRTKRDGDPGPGHVVPQTARTNRPANPSALGHGHRQGAAARFKDRSGPSRRFASGGVTATVKRWLFAAKRPKLKCPFSVFDTIPARSCAAFAGRAASEPSWRLSHGTGQDARRRNFGGSDSGMGTRMGRQAPSSCRPVPRAGFLFRSGLPAEGTDSP